MKTPQVFSIAGLILITVFAQAAAKPKVVEIDASDVQKILKAKFPIPDNRLQIQTKFVLQETAPPLELPDHLKMEIPKDIQSETHFAIAHGYFNVPVPVEQLLDKNFWKISNVKTILTDYKLTQTAVLANGSDGTVSVPIGFTFGLAPDSLDCKFQLRTDDKGDGPIQDYQINADWGKPLLTVYQMNSECNMFFAGFVTVTSIYRMTDGTAGLFSQSFLYVKDSAVEKLHSVRFLAGTPAQAIGDKIKDQTVSFVKGLRAIKPIGAKE